MNKEVSDNPQLSQDVDEGRWGSARDCLSLTSVDGDCAHTVSNQPEVSEERK